MTTAREVAGDSAPDFKQPPRIPRRVHLVSVAMAVLAILIAARIALYLISPTHPDLIGTWTGAGSGCGMPMCVLNPDSIRYAELTEFFVVTGPLSDDPLSLLQAGDVYEGSFLGASKNGVSYSYVSSLLVAGLDLSSYTANSLLAFMSAILLGLVLASVFERRRLPREWLVASVISPISTYYGNQAMKETWDVLLLVVLVEIFDRFGRREVRRPRIAVLLGLMVAVLLYFDREYFLYIALFIGSWLLAASIENRRQRIVAATTAAGILGVLVAFRANHTFSPLSSYYLRYSTGSESFGSVESLAAGLPRTLLAPIGGLGDAGQSLLLFLSLPVFWAYIACLSLSLQARLPVVRGRGVGFCDPRVIAFFTMSVLWTVTYGGGFERGRDAMAPLLFWGVARWQAAMNPTDARTGASGRPATPDRGGRSARSG